MKKIILILVLICLSSFVLANTPPQLTGGGAKPAFAKPGTTVTYKVEYSDADGDAPAYVRVHFPPPIGLKEMKKVSGNYKAGATYEYSWKPDKSWEYWFEASDGKATARAPDYERGTLAPTDILPEMPENNRIFLFARGSNTPLWIYDTGKDWVHKVVISSDGNYIAVKTNDYIYLFSRESNKPVWKHQCMSETGKNKEAVAGWVSISSNGNYIAGGCQGSLNLFSTKNNNPLWTYDAKANVYTVSISSDGQYIVMGTMGTNEVVLFSRSTNKPIWKFTGEGDIHGLAISADGNYIAAGAHCPDRRVFLFSRQNNQPLVSYLASEDSPVWTADASSDGRYVVYGLDGGDGFNNIFIFSPDKREPIKGYSVGGPVRSVSMSKDGKYITAGSGVDYRVYLFDKDSDQEIWQYKAGERVGSVSISSDGNYIVAGSKDKSIYLFSKESNEPSWNYKASEWVNSVAISADGNYIVAGTGASQYLSEAHAISPEEELAGKTPLCGDTICEGSETSESCPQDCTKPGNFEEIDEIVEEMKEETICGNDICEEPQENYENCPNDCCGEDCEDKDDFEGKIEIKEEKTGLFQAIIEFFKHLFGG